VEKTELLYEGKTKKVYATANPELRVFEFKDDVVAFNGLKKGKISGKSVINNKISSILMGVLEGNGVPTHFVKRISETEQVVKFVEIIPIEVLARNVAAGSLSKRLGLPEGAKMNSTVYEYCYKNNDLGDPLINTSHVVALGIATDKELKYMLSIAEKTNAVLKEYLKKAKVDLIDFKLEFSILSIRSPIK
jgi:phosphoribosylaminoimidazole-succinocarboxamide synthase